MEIDEKRMERLEKLERAHKRQINKQNEHIKQNYKRVSVVLKNDIFESIKDKYGDISLNGYINKLILRDLQK